MRRISLLTALATAAIAVLGLTPALAQAARLQRERLQLVRLGRAGFWVHVGLGELDRAGRHLQLDERPLRAVDRH
ncbi:MAG: hypothetical protein ACR2KJ_16780 [Jatrophihabitans sp.]